VESYLTPQQETLVAIVLGDRTAGREEELRGVAAQVRTELGRHEAVLAERQYLAGATLTAADLVLYPTLMLIGRIGTRESARALGLGLDTLRADHPAMERWAQSIESTPGYDATYPPHWRQ
jgi:glutathione S-transferase